MKPWDDETDMAELEKEVRKITMDGLLWGACKYSNLLFSSTRYSIKWHIATKEHTKSIIHNLAQYFTSNSQLGVHLSVWL